MVLPQWQKKGWGRLLIEFSKVTASLWLDYPLNTLITGYELNHRIAPDKIGTPERPLSDLGTAGYLAYWIGVIIRYFIKQFAVLDPNSKLIDVIPPLPPATRYSKKPAAAPAPSSRPALATNLNAPTPNPAEPTVSSERMTRRQSALAHGGSQARAAPAPMEGRLAISVAKIAEECVLRVDDVVFALEQCGLAKYRKTVARPAAASIASDDDEDEEDEEGYVEKGELQLIVTPELVLEVAKTWRVKHRYLENEYVLV